MSVGQRVVVDLDHGPVRKHPLDGVRFARVEALEILPDEILGIPGAVVAADGVEADDPGRARILRELVLRRVEIAQRLPVVDGQPEVRVEQRDAVAHVLQRRLKDRRLSRDLSLGTPPCGDVAVAAKDPSVR